MKYLMDCSWYQALMLPFCNLQPCCTHLYQLFLHCLACWAARHQELTARAHLSW